MQLLSGSLRAYPWGSCTLMAQLRGETEPSERREAELWFGAHPGSPSMLGETPLPAVLNKESVGARIFDEFGADLPFLLKILAADEPLSLQAHPSAAQAEEGFAREEAAGIELLASNRNYKDPNHKPELIVALTEFSALAGFRPLAKTQRLFKVLDCPELDRHLTIIDDDPAHESDNLRALFTTWITIPAGMRAPLVDAVVSKACAVVESAGAGRDDVEPWMLDVFANICMLGEKYPGDIGVLGALLLNKVNLQPGEALYLDAGQLHAYMHGMGVEIMANSDNVLRGGLTSKYVDVAELVKVLAFSSLEDPRVKPVVSSDSSGTQVDYPVPAKEFQLRRHDIVPGSPLEFSHDGPAVLLCTHGLVEAAQGGRTPITLTPTMAVWVPANDDVVTLSGEGSVFIAKA